MEKAGISQNKKSHGWIIALIIIALIIILPIAFVFIFFFDNSSKELNLKKDWDNTLSLERIAIDSFDNTKEDKKINFKLDEQDLNELIYKNVGDALKNTQAEQFIRQAYVTIENDQYIFSIEAQAFGFQTKLSMYTTLSSQAVEGDTILTFAINDIQVGRMNNVLSFGRDILTSFITDQQVESIFAEAGFNLKVSLSDTKITYSVVQLSKDVKSIIIQNFNEGDFYYALMSDIIKYELIGFEFNANKAAEVFVNLSKLQTNLNYMEENHLEPYNPSDDRDKVVQLVNDGIIDTTHAIAVMEYITRGYDYDFLTSSDKEYIKSKDFSSIGITDNENYKGHIAVDESSVASSIAGTFDATAFTSPTYQRAAYVSEEVINNVLRGTSALGYTFLLGRKVDSSWKLNFLAVNDLYCNIVDNAMYLVFDVNINGYNISLIIVTEKDTTYVDGLEIKLATKNIFLGECDVSEELENKFISLMADILSSENNWIKLDANSRVFTIDLTSSIPSAYSSLLSLCDSKVEFSGENISDNGLMEIYTKLA